MTVLPGLRRRHPDRRVAIHRGSPVEFARRSAFDGRPQLGHLSQRPGCVGTWPSVHCLKTLTLSIVLTIAGVQEQVTVAASDTSAQVSIEIGLNQNGNSIDRDELDRLSVFDHDYITTWTQTLPEAGSIWIAKPSMRRRKRQHRTPNCSIGRRTKRPKSGRPLGSRWLRRDEEKICAATGSIRLQELIVTLHD
ncbi:MAG: hypothetical protein QOJ51_1618 [Acidobacteriaceae bacterium]|jgi:hypothetical protein|nr:hypothetical protein [Acidobacteriaceae bacterium]MEA2258793.1 hypothetical protein [Acidobacteriaceae bacterium]